LLKKKDSMELFSKYLKDMRIKKGVSQRELAELLGYTSGQFVSNYERGMCPVPLDKVKDLIGILNLDSTKVVNLIQEDRKKSLLRTLDLDDDRSRRRA
jgi:transcriptional regulator with XRE-family HTH domain